MVFPLVAGAVAAGGGSGAAVLEAVGVTAGMAAAKAATGYLADEGTQLLKGAYHAIKDHVADNKEKRDSKYPEMNKPDPNHKKEELREMKKQLDDPNWVTKLPGIFN